MNKKTIAYTLAEILITFVIIGVVVTVTAVATISNSDIKKKKIAVSSKSFYTGVTGIYSRATQETRTFNIKKHNAEKLVEEFGKYMDISSPDIDCSELKINGFNPDKCAKLVSGIKMGVKIDSSCTTNLDVYEYLNMSDIKLNLSEINTRKINNACGYVIYTTKKSERVFKQDAFVIPLMRHVVG